jgi:hypothetical protein
MAQRDEEGSRISQCQGHGRTLHRRIRPAAPAGHELFPAGSSEDDLIDYLDAEGFVPEWPRRNGQNAGRFVHDGLICTKIVRVLWRSDDRGKLTNISGGYASSCLTALSRTAI